MVFMCLVLCVGYVESFVRWVVFFLDFVQASGGGTQGSGLNITGLNLVLVVSYMTHFLP